MKTITRHKQRARAASHLGYGANGRRQNVSMSNASWTVFADGEAVAEMDGNRCELIAGVADKQYCAYGNWSDIQEFVSKYVNTEDIKMTTELIEKLEQTHRNHMDVVCTATYKSQRDNASLNALAILMAIRYLKDDENYAPVWRETKFMAGHYRVSNLVDVWLDQPFTRHAAVKRVNNKWQVELRDSDGTVVGYAGIWDTKEIATEEAKRVLAS